MKSRALISGTVVGCLVVGAISLAAERHSAKAKEPSHDEMMAAYMKVANPGDHHNSLKPLAGSWQTISKVWTAPDQMQISEGSCQTEWVMGGRYLKEECTGRFGGQPFNGMGLSGYDNQEKKYVGTWIDTTGTGILSWEGSMDSTRKVLNSSSTVINPVTGKKDKVKMVTKIYSNDRHTFSMYEMRNGKETLTLELTYTRQ